MMPLWRKLSDSVELATKRFTGLNERAQVIDNRMQEYQEIQAESVKAERMLTSSAATQFFIAGFVRRWVVRSIDRIGHVDNTISTFVGSVARYAVLIITFTVAVSRPHRYSSGLRIAEQQ